MNDTHDVTHHDADIAIVGGGIAGQSLAAALGELGSPLRIVVLEGEGTLGYHTSSRSASQMQPSYGPPEIRALTAATLALMPGIEQTLGTSILSPRPLIWCGVRGSSAQVDSVLASVPDAREGSIDEAVTRLPVLRASALESVAFDENAKEVDVAALLGHYQARMSATGVTVLHTARLAGATQTADGWTLAAGSHRVHTRTVVNAAGAWADPLAELFGKAPRGLQPYRRTITVAPSTSRAVDPAWPMACDMGDSFYFRPQGGEILASPLEDEASTAEDARPRPTEIDAVKQRINAVTDLALGPSTRSWTGLRTLSATGLPVVGREPG
ncbi:FAD-dependent oxidoreductase, partial [Subtercola sp. Z020]|uniref:NAD(P)/FAD-dependent oxidoreductase n=1 Tax=Subtercola sp. Z020 TaxID=2080582 RepID=UPI000CE84ACD